MTDLTEAEIVAVRKAQVGRYGACDVTRPYSDSIAFALAVIKAQREKDAAADAQAGELPDLPSSIEYLVRHFPGDRAAIVEWGRACQGTRGAPGTEAPSLWPVIQWLEGGCDPKEAAKELRLYAERMGQPASGVPGPDGSKR